MHRADASVSAEQCCPNGGPPRGGRILAREGKAVRVDPSEGVIFSSYPPTIAKHMKEALSMTLQKDLLFDEVNFWAEIKLEIIRKYASAYSLIYYPNKIKFISCEPLLGSVKDIDLKGIDWVIVGGESGRSPRPLEKSWVLCRSHRDTVTAA